MKNYLIVCLAFCSCFSFSLDAVGEEKEECDAIELNIADFNNGDDVFVKIKDDSESVDFHVSRGCFCGDKVITVEKKDLYSCWSFVCRAFGIDKDGKTPPKIEDLTNIHLKKIRVGTVRRLVAVLKDIQELKKAEGNGSSDASLQLAKDFKESVYKNPKQLAKLVPLIKRHMPQEDMINIVRTARGNGDKVIYGTLASTFMLSVLFLVLCHYRDSGLGSWLFSMGPSVVGLCIAVWIVDWMQDVGEVWDGIGDPNFTTRLLA
jgi:hypothetical protein